MGKIATSLRRNTDCIVNEKNKEHSDSGFNSEEVPNKFDI